MIYAIQLVGSCFLAMWFCYWATGAFSSLHNRECRIACLSCPVLLSLLLIAFPDVLLNPLGDLTGVFHLSPGRQGATLVIAVAMFLIICTLLITSLVGQLRLLRHRITEMK
jgi:hypothetical protein